MKVKTDCDGMSLKDVLPSRSDNFDACICLVAYDFAHTSVIRTVSVGNIMYDLLPIVKTWYYCNIY